jgi:hypothetical protein
MSNIKPNTLGYGPKNRYYSDTFIVAFAGDAYTMYIDWSSIKNDNLW